MPASALKREFEQLPQPWGETTDPAQHDPDNFRYLIHAVNPFAKMSALSSMIYDQKDGRVADESWGDQSISMYNSPERVAERVSLSMSLIDQAHTATWGNGGLIVEAPEENVLFTDTSDAGSNNNNLDFLHEQAQKRHILDADTLLRASSPHEYNEIVAVANRNDHPIQLKGFFYKVTADGEPLDTMVADTMKMHAERLDLPLVTIAEPRRFGEDKVDKYKTFDDEKELTAVNYNGRRYLLDGFEKEQFKFINERGHYHFSSPDEIESALEFALASGGMTNEEIEKIASRYKEADRSRQTPTTEFEEDGSFKRIVYREGYGSDEVEVYLLKSGHGNRIDLARQADRISKIFLDSSHGMDMLGDDGIHTPVSPIEAEEMVNKACEDLDKAKAVELRKWYKEHADITAREWQHHQGRRSLLGASSLRYFK